MLVTVDRFEEGLDLASESVEILTEAHGPTDWRTIRAESVVGAALLGLGDHEGAESLLDNSFEVLRAERGLEDRVTREALRWLIQLYEETDRPDEATRSRSLLDG